MDIDRLKMPRIQNWNKPPNFNKSTEAIILISINFHHFQARIFLPPTSLDTKSTSCWLWRIHLVILDLPECKYAKNQTAHHFISCHFPRYQMRPWSTIRPERSFVQQTVSWWTAFVPGSKRSLEVRPATPENPTESVYAKSLEGFEMSSRWWQCSANRQPSSTIRFVRWPNRLSNSRVLESRVSLQGDLWTVIDVKQLGVLEREGSFDCSCCLFLQLRPQHVYNSMLQVDMPRWSTILWTGI